MIITPEIIHKMTCPESIAWFDSHPYYYGLTRKEFNKLLREEEKAGKLPQNWWGTWADENFIAGEAIVHSKKLKRLGIYKILVPGLTPQEFDNIDDAVAVLENIKTEQVKTEDQFFQVQVRHRRGPNGYEITQFCDTTKDTCDISISDEYFSTFNIYTGQYEDYPTYGQAKNRMIELRNSRHMEHANNLMIYEKIAEVGDPNFNGEDFVPVQTLTGRKTYHYDVLEKVERRPDPKPRKPKP